MVNKDTAMDDTQEKLKILLDYWIEHNSEHEQEFRDWADKVAPSYTEVANQLEKAAIKMASVSDDLVKAKQALPRSKERHPNVHG
jgi:rubrerythrin